MDKYFAEEDAQLVVKFGANNGGRVGTAVKGSFAVHDAKTGNPAIVSPADVTTTVDGPARVVQQTRGAANKYAAHFNTGVAGLYKITATVRGKFSATYQLRVSDQTDPSLCRAEGPTNAKSGSTYSFKTIVVDKGGSPLATDLGDQLAVSVTAVEGSYSSIDSKANGDGTFTTTMNILKSGVEFTVEVKVNEVAVGNSPFRFKS